MRFGSAPRLLDYLDSKRVFFYLVIANLVGLLLALLLLGFFCLAGEERLHNTLRTCGKNCNNCDCR